ncbi:MAG: hypothetical protein B6I28_05985 [Fusobacteriia bacterium 4572_132]|nr:MAG: hypothetical protein B6I28_05985 [Fusobacteriia bacterium 4572_132]
MELDDFFEISILLNYYKKLLSKKQKIYMSEYYEKDYSLTEIANEYKISRQAVYENIKRGADSLKKYEKELSFYKRDVKMKNELKKLRKNFTLEKIDEILNNFII